MRWWALLLFCDRYNPQFKALIRIILILDRFSSRIASDPPGSESSQVGPRLTTIL